MKLNPGLTVFLAVLLFCLPIAAQRPEVAITLNEAFFDSLLDAIFQNAPPPEFSIAASGTKRNGSQSMGFANGSYRSDMSYTSNKNVAQCKEAVQLQRENNGVRTAVRFRDGKILAPLAFTGNYNPPFVGCVPFSGYAETAIDLEFDQPNQRLIAKARVLNVYLNGIGGVGGSLVAKLVQSSIDKRINPIEIIRTDKLSFALPIQNGSSVKMKATGFRHELDNGALRLIISYEFTK